MQAKRMALLATVAVLGLGSLSAQTIIFSFNGTLGPIANGTDCLNWNGVTASVQAEVSTSAKNLTPSACGGSCAEYNIPAGNVTGSFGATDFTSTAAWKIKYEAGNYDFITLSGAGPEDTTLTLTETVLTTGAIQSTVFGSSGHPAALQPVLLTDFGPGNLSGWTLAGADQWTIVNGCTDSSPSICPPAGATYFAASGEPNTPSEAYTGTATSPAFTVAFDTFSWQANGWSGSSYNGESYYQVLDAHDDVKAQFDAPESNSWTGLTTNLITDGLTAGAKFHFRAVDEDSATTYGWLAMDSLTLSGNALLTAPNSYLTYTGCSTTDTRLGLAGTLNNN